MPRYEREEEGEIRLWVRPKTYCGCGVYAVTSSPETQQLTRLACHSMYNIEASKAKIRGLVTCQNLARREP